MLFEFDEAAFELRSCEGSITNLSLLGGRNLALKQFRGAGREDALDDLIEEPPIPAREQPLRRLLNEELSLKVQEAVFNLPPLQREALVLFEYEELTLSEIASVVGADVGAVKARLHRARERLRTTLRPYLNSSLEIVTFGEVLK